MHMLPPAVYLALLIVATHTTSSALYCAVCILHSHSHHKPLQNVIRPLLWISRVFLFSFFCLKVHHNVEKMNNYTLLISTRLSDSSDVSYSHLSNVHYFAFFEQEKTAMVSNINSFHCKEKPVN